MQLVTASMPSNEHAMTNCAYVNAAELACRVDEIDPDHRPPYWSIITRAGQELLPAGFEERLKSAWFGILSTHFGKDIEPTEAEVFTGFGP